MKIGNIPVASIILIVFAGASFVSRFFIPSHYHAIAPYLDGGLIGGLLVIGLYYANIYLTAWNNNRKEATSAK